MINFLPLAFRLQSAGGCPCASPVASRVFYSAHLPATRQAHTNDVMVAIVYVMYVDDYYMFSVTRPSSLTRLMYCTTSFTNDLLISSFSLWGEFYQQSQQNPLYSAPSGGHGSKSISTKDTYSSVTFLSLDLASLIFSCLFLSIFFFRSFFSLRT